MKILTFQKRLQTSTLKSLLLVNNQIKRMPFQVAKRDYSNFQYYFYQSYNIVALLGLFEVTIYSFIMITCLSCGDTVLLTEKRLKYRFRLQKGVKMKNRYHFWMEHGRVVYSYIYQFPDQMKI